MDLTTVADDLVVIHDGAAARRFEGLAPATTYELAGVTVRTLPRPGGELLCRLATVNDVHFGEEECGRIDDHVEGPIRRVDPGEPPYPETMNAGAAAEIEAIQPVAVFAKGDLTTDGRPEEFAAFEQCYVERFGARLYPVRGNHDAYRGQQQYEGDQWVELPGACVALLDTTIPTETTGQVTAAQREWLADHAATADRPVLVLGHHQQWVEGNRSPDYFGINPDDSEALTEVITGQRRIVAYAAGHTHRHRTRLLAAAGGVPTIEVGCVKDFPGTWAEYRVFDGGILQVIHRVGTPAALAWSEQCRTLYSDFGVDYETYALGRLEDRCFTIPWR